MVIMKICLSLTGLRRLSKDIHQSKLLCGTYSWKTHGPLMNHSWRGGILEIPQDPCGFLKLPCDPGIWPRTKQKKGTLMNRSWSTHEPLIKGALWIQIHLFIHTFLMNKAFCGILGIPKDSFGPLRICRWISCRIPDPWLSWMICLSITDLRGLFKDVHQSKFFVAPTHEKLMTPSWTTHESNPEMLYGWPFH